MIGSSARPLAVRAYSTRGGTSGKVWRATIASSSSARKRNESVRGLIPESARSSSQKREVPSASSRTSKSVHLPQTMSAVRHTGHVSSTAISLFTLPSEVTGSPFARRCIVPLVLVLASIGPVIVGVVIIAALALLAVLLRDP